MINLLHKLLPLAALTLALSLPTALSAQTQCKYVRTATDEWTKKATRTAQMTIGNGFAGREVILQESEGKLYLGLRLTYNTDFPDVAFKKGDKVTFKLADEKLIEIAAAEDVPAQIFRVGELAMRQWLIRQEVSREVYQQLAASPITAIKFHINGNDYGLPEIKDRQTRKIAETVQCMLDTTPH